ncbi:MAG: cobalamin adenosyltransferase, partial [Oscillospiraceae bacterium]
LIALQAVTERAGAGQLTAELEELLQYCRGLLAAEVTEKPLPPMKLLGLDEAGLREHSHHPQAHYGMGHLLPSHQLGEIGAGLNLLRTASREVELAAAEAFCLPDGTAQRGDLLQGLNRLSSACYLLMLQWAAKTLRRNEESEHE